MLIALLLACALVISLQAQMMGSPLAGAWLLPLLAACGVAMDSPRRHKMEAVGYAALAWLLMLGLHTFFIRPISGGAATMWVLAAAPVIALSLRPQHIKPCIMAVFAVLLVYAIGVILQEIFQVQYTAGWAEHTGRSWPVLDPNNGACILNFGLIGAFYMALHHRIRWLLAVSLFAAAIIITHSRAGILAGAGCCYLIAYARHKKALSIITLLVLAPLGLLLLGVFPSILDPVGDALQARINIWEGAVSLITPRGLGLGSYYFYYPQVAVENISGGWYAHNDALQILIETGYAGLFAFMALVLSVAFTTNQKNLLPAAMLLMALLQAMVEFQFYVPAVSILCGLALAWHLSSRGV